MLSFQIMVNETKQNTHRTEERLTEQLLERLLASATPEAYLREAQRLLRIADVAELYCKVRRDAILIWCIDHGFTREEADDELFRLGEKTLLGTGTLR